MHRQADYFDVWCVDTASLGSHADSLASLLGIDERRRASAFVFERDRQRFVIARACLRIILSWYVDLPPRFLRFDYGEHGKPFLVWSRDASPTFSLSHSEDVAVVAVTHGRAVGIDVETIRPEPFLHLIADHFFADEEASELSQLSEAIRERAFFQCWARKEALLKGAGVGLSIPLNSFRVSTNPSQPARIYSSTERILPGEAWSIVDLDIRPDLAAAVAIEGQRVTLALDASPRMETSATEQLYLTIAESAASAWMRSLLGDMQPVRHFLCDQRPQPLGSEKSTRVVCAH
jgi:4'-phosphopantetheinyl transferase